MAKTRRKGDEVFHICDDCRYCEWHTQYWNLDPLGQPITFGCTKEVFKNGEVRGKRACSLWEAKS